MVKQVVGFHIQTVFAIFVIVTIQPMERKRVKLVPLTVEQQTETGLIIPLTVQYPVSGNYMS